MFWFNLMPAVSGRLVWLQHLCHLLSQFFDSLCPIHQSVHVRTSCNMVKTKLAVMLCFHQFLEFFDFFFHNLYFNWLNIAPSEEGFLGFLVSENLYVAHLEIDEDVKIYASVSKKRNSVVLLGDDFHLLCAHEVIDHIICHHSQS